MNREEYLMYLERINSLDITNVEYKQVLESFFSQNKSVDYDKIFVVDKECLELMILPNNSNEFGSFFINSRLGHDCFSHELVSTTYYYVLDGQGKFIIDNKEVLVQIGDIIKIEPNVVFYYEGTMKLLMIMVPNFEEKNHVVDKIVTYNNSISM